MEQSKILKSREENHIGFITTVEIVVILRVKHGPAFLVRNDRRVGEENLKRTLSGLPKAVLGLMLHLSDVTE